MLKKYNLEIEKLIANLKNSIDQLQFREAAKSQILEAARVLDETKQCERRNISMRIKEYLRDKVKEGKITSRWIHHCLPSEYKRQYKREAPSLLSCKIHVSDSSHEVSQEQNKENLSHFKIRVFRENFWKNIIEPLSRSQEEWIRVNVELDENVGNATLTVE